MPSAYNTTNLAPLVRHTRGFTPPFGRVIKLLRSCHRTPLNRRGADGLQLLAGDGEVSRFKKLLRLVRTEAGSVSAQVVVGPNIRRSGRIDSLYSNRSWRADERTRPADLISLPVRGQWLLGVARFCKFRICKVFSVPCVAHDCWVLHAD